VGAYRASAACSTGYGQLVHAAEGTPTGSGACPGLALNPLLAQALHCGQSGRQASVPSGHFRRCSLPRLTPFAAAFPAASA
jgi:hypothetical protein